tara:strand:+ start:9355 stop:10758 length:1404 start_codon:yes stop_codon:yes gene_type:complete
MKFLRNITGFRFAISPLAKKSLSRRENLVNIIRHANTTTPFYKGKYDSFLEGEKNLSDEEFFYAFSHLPIVEKQDLRSSNEQFKSDHLNDKVDLLENGAVPTFGKFLKHFIIKKDFFTTISTGGSSGVPTFRWLDYPDANIFAQSFLHSFKLNGWKQGESFVVYYPLKSYFTGAYAQNAKPLNRYFGFTMVPFEDITKESVEELLKTLRDTKATLLVIFPCVLQRIAEIMHQENIEPFAKLPYINVSGEFFMDCSKKFIQTLFPDSDIQCTYGAVEFGEIAHQNAMSSVDYDAFDYYVFLEQGPQNSMLVTAYHQKSFPLIRYRIEDMGQVVNHENGTQSITSLEGKNSDYLIGADDYIYFASFFNNFVNELNKALNNPIIHFMLRHGQDDQGTYLQLNFVLEKSEKEDKIKEATLESLGGIFSNFDRIDVQFPDHFQHDYTRKFKIIGEGDGQNEVVGGYYQRKAS